MTSWSSLRRSTTSHRLLHTARYPRPTRVGKRFLVIDLKRQTTLALTLMAAVKPALQLLLMPWSSLRYLFHDGYISTQRAYSPAAFQALGRAVSPTIQIEFVPTSTGPGPQSLAVLFSNPGPTEHA